MTDYRDVRRGRMKFQNLFHKENGETGKSSFLQEDRVNQLEEEIIHLKQNDLLTGVWNRVTVLEYLDTLEQQSVRPGLFFIGIDQMAMINTRFGDVAGDSLLREIADLLKYCAPDDAVVGRMEGDVFAVLIADASKDIMSEVGSRILFSVREMKGNQVGIPDQDYRIRVSIGSSLWDKKVKFDKNSLIQQARAALKEAKKNGKNQQIEFSENQTLFLKMQSDRDVKIDTEARMHTALAAGEFFPVFQPQYDIESETIVGLEMLSRWCHPEKGNLMPSYYLSTFESNQFIIELDLYMFEQACSILKRWKEEKRPILPISCNFSELHCYNPFWVAQLKQITRKYHVSPTYLKIEIGENALLVEKDKMTEQINKLRKEGFLVFLQGFGAGFSSVGILQDTTVDGVKIDRSIIMNDFSQENNQMIFAGILAIAKMLKLRVYGIGIESDRQDRLIKKHGCYLAQGNYYCPPVSLTEIESLILENSRDVAGKKKNSYNTEQGREFLETVLDDYYILKDIDRVDGLVTDQIEWKDLFREEEFNGKEEWKDYFKSCIKERELQVNLYTCTVYQQGRHSLAISGEGSFQEEQESGSIADRRFCLYAECICYDEGLKLDRLRMMPIYGSMIGNMRSLEDSMEQTRRIRENQKVLDDLYAMMPIGIMRFDREIDMLITYINDAMFQIIGYTKEEFFEELHGNIRKIVYPGDLEKTCTKAYEIMETEEMEPIEFRYVRKDGRIMKVCLYQYNVVGVSGRMEIQTMCYPLSGY